MKIVLAELMILQAKAVAVMFCAGVLVESLWQLKNRAKCRFCRKKEDALKANEKIATYRRMWLRESFIEGAFWISAAVILCKFLYYGAFGRLTLYSVAGFFAGLLLWKKLCCVILKEVWVEKEEAVNSKTTARSSISIRPENRGWKKDGQKRRKKKKK